MSTAKPLYAQALRHWQALAPREQRLVLTAATVLAVALFWWVGLAPALATLRHAGLRQHELDAQWQQMQGLQAETRALQAQTRLPRSEVIQALESSVHQRLAGSGQLSIQGDRATLTLKAAPAEALAQWLVQARVNARLLPSEMRINRSTAAGAQAADAQGVSWDGTLSLSLPTSDVAP